ncbi:MAG: threonine ammonia-lyase [Steroidobacteraceae bacterium]
MTKWVEVGDIEAAAQRIRGAVTVTPCAPSRTLSAITGCELFLKFENQQFTASFKERGALNKLLQLDAGERARGVCAMSAGNHAQGVAYHAARLSIPATIVMPRGTPLVKIARTREHGATVEIAGSNLSEAMQVAQARTREQQLTFVHPYDDPAVIAGQGTIGIEMLRAVPELDVLVIPIGGGGLISGIATAAKALRPGIQIIGVQSLTYPSMQRALRGDSEPCADGLTIAEGIAVKTAGQLTRQLVARHVDDIVLASEPSIERAVALLLSVEKTVVEGAGAAGLGAILEHPARFAGRRVGTVLSGGNIDLRVIASVAMRELVRGRQLLRFAVPISDQPGALAQLAAVIGQAGANIVDVTHERLSLALNPRGASLELVVEVQDSSHGHAVLEALRRGGFTASVKTL